MPKRKNSTCDAESSKKLKEKNDSDIVIIQENEQTNESYDDSFINNLNDVLKESPKSGDYSFHGETKELPLHPGLEIENFGPVGLPLNDCQVSELIKIYNQSLSSRTNEFNTYQIPPEKVKITNKEWHKSLEVLVDTVAEKLGSTGKCEAKLNKLLIYKTGGHFLKHKNTEKEKTLFASLTICLPCEYTGGQLVVYENENKSQQVIDFKNTKYSINFTAYHQDLEHELLEVKSGYKLVLNYSIYWINENDAIRFKNNNSQLLKTIDILNNLQDPDFQIGLLLDHRYLAKSFASRGINALKGIDLDRYELLKKANEQLAEEKKLSFFTVHGNHIKNSLNEDYGCDNDDEINIDTKFYAGTDSDEESKCSFDERDCDWDTDVEESNIAECYDLDGKAIFEGETKWLSDDLDVKTASIDFASFTHIISPTLDDVEVDMDDVENWGNMRDKEFENYNCEGVRMTITYHKYMLAFMRKSHAFSLTLTSNPERAIDLFYQSQAEVNSSHLNNLLNGIKKKDLGKNSWFKMFQVLIRFNDLKIARMYLRNVKQIDGDYISHLVELFQHFGYDTLSDAFIKIINVNIKNLSFLSIMIEVLLSKAMEEESYDFYTKTVLELIKSCGQEKIEMNTVIELMRITRLLVEKNKNLESVLERLKNIVRRRVEILRKKLECRQNPNSWCMPDAILRENLDIELFLKSNHERIVYRGFNGITAAKAFIRCYSGFRNGYSCTMVASGMTKNTIVEITKTRDIFNQKEREFQVYEKEINQLTPFI